MRTNWAVSPAAADVAREIMALGDIAPTQGLYQREGGKGIYWCFCVYMYLPGMYELRLCFV
jgi:hypothetical protein